MKNFSDTYITKFGWMVEITDNRYEADALALIYGFTQDGVNWFQGTLKYIQKWIGCGRTTAIKTLDTLVEKGILRKVSNTENHITKNEYQVNIDTIQKLRKGGTPDEHPVRDANGGGTSRERGGGTSRGPYNTNIDNTKDRDKPTHETETFSQTTTRILYAIKEHPIGEMQFEDIKSRYGLTETESEEVLRDLITSFKSSGYHTWIADPNKYMGKILARFDKFAKNAKKWKKEAEPKPEVTYQRMRKL